MEHFARSAHRVGSVDLLREQRWTDRKHSRDRRAPGPGVKRSAEHASRDRRYGRLPRAQLPRARVRGWRSGERSRVAGPGADERFDPRGEPPWIGPGRNQVGAATLCGPGRKQGRCQERQHGS